MLSRFVAPVSLRAGARVAERHTILGIPQIYLGRITEYEPFQRWGMTSRPRGWSPVPLAHDVSYTFHAQGPVTRVTIRCLFTSGALLGFPVLSSLTAWYMKHTIKRLQTRISDLVLSEMRG